jgi:hypothetical protein
MPPAKKVSGSVAKTLEKNSGYGLEILLCDPCFTLQTPSWELFNYFKLKGS